MMNIPIKLPSGKILNLSKFIALIPCKNSSEQVYELILEGYESTISLDKTDEEALSKLLKLDANLSLETAQQLEKNQSAMTLLKQWIETDKNRQSTPEDEKYFEEFKKIIDAERSSSQKLYLSQ